VRRTSSKRRALSHVGKGGAARMVDVSGKPVTAREAVARGRIRIAPAAMRLVRAARLAKGGVVEVALLAGILAAIAFESGDLAKAETLAARALALEPRLRTGRYNLARIREAKGDAGAAAALYAEELESYPDNGRARFNLAQLRRARGDRQGYLRELAACVEKAPEFGTCYFYLAREELGAGRLDAAQDLATRGLAAQARSEAAPLGHFVLADVYSRRGEAGKAEDEAAKGRKLEAALRKNPAPRL